LDRAHIHLDEFAHLQSFFHRFDPRAKIISCLFLLVVAVSLKTPTGLGFTLCGIFLLTFLARLPAGRILMRLGFVIPIVVVLCLFLPFARPGIPLFSLNAGSITLNYTLQGLQASGLFFLRLLCAALIIILVTFTTPFHILLRSLIDLKVPAIFIQLIQFTLRYFFVLYDEVIRMSRARRSRNFRPGKNFWNRQTFSTLGGLMGVLFIRSYDRGERIYYAMLARGYRGEVRVLDDLQVSSKDFAIGTALVVYGIVSLIIDRGWWGWLHY
jgi:cobalt/nickel transport system permease protein